MFCPSCRYEYRDGISQCPDCNETLISHLPEKETDQKVPPEYVDMVTVLEASDHSTLLFAQSLLEGEGIEVFIQGGLAVGSMGIGLVGYNPINGAIKMQVRQPDSERALAILADLSNESSS